MKRDIRENEEFLTLKTMMTRKKLSLTKVSKSLGYSREYIYICFHNNKREVIDKVFGYVSNI